MCVSNILYGIKFMHTYSEHCVAVWDFEHEKLQKLSHGEGASSLAWLPDSAHLLVAGTSMGWIRLYDTRAGGNQAAVISFIAHPAPRPRKVRGIRCSPFHHSTMATFSDGAGDAVRLWDLRRHPPTNSKQSMTQIFTVVPNITSGNSANNNAVVQDVCWSPARPHILATAVTGQRSVSFYSTAQHSAGDDCSTSVPIFQVATPEPPRSLSWRGLDARNLETFNQLGSVFDWPAPSSAAGQNWDLFAKSDDSALHCIPKAFFNPEILHAEHDVGRSNYSPSPFNSLLAASGSGVVEIEVRDRCALAVSTAGDFAAGFGETLLLSSGSSSSRALQYPHSLLEDSVRGCLTSTAAVMQYRAALGYSIDEGRNLEVLQGELDHVYTCIHEQSAHPTAFTAGTTQFELCARLAQVAAIILEVYKVYVWADRFEALTNQTNLSLGNCGVLDIMLNETKVTDAQQNYRCLYHSTLGADVYLSKSRFLVKKICGWIDILGVERGETLHLATSASGNNISTYKTGSGSNGDLTQMRALQQKATTTAADDEDDHGLLEVIVSECLDGFERSAAMALWHGDVGLAVHVLRKAMEKYEQEARDRKDAFEIAASEGAAPRVAIPKTLSATAESRCTSPMGQGRFARVNSTSSNRFSDRADGDFRDCPGENDEEDEDDEGFTPVPRDYRSSEAFDGRDEEDEVDVDWDAPLTAEYMTLVSLVGMCLAGYNHAASNNSSKFSASFGGRTTAPSAWAGMCKHVLSQLQQSRRRGTSYLSACCIFLLANIISFITAIG